MANAGRTQTTGPGFGESRPMTSEPENVETILPADASALLATAAGGFDFVMSNAPDDAEVQQNVQLQFAVMLRSKDPEWIGEMVTCLEARNSVT